MAKIFKVDFGTGALDAVKSDSRRNNLPVGTVLETERHGTRSVIVKNMGRCPYGGGVQYKTINLDTYAESQTEAACLKWISEKEDNRIQTYITDEVMPLGEVDKAFIEAARLKTEAKAKIAAAEAEKKRLAEMGRELFEKYIPPDAKALIIAERHENDSDPMSDYYSHKVRETVIVGYSKHTRDLFSEMRKAAENFEETKHLGVGKGHFAPYVAIRESFTSNGYRHYEGGHSPWHRELSKDDTGRDIVFSTKEEAEAFIQSKGDPGSISIDGLDIPLIWKIEEYGFEHREKYSMGAGYYLKDGSRDCDGWCIRKVSKYEEQWDERYFVSIALKCIFQEKTSK